MLFPEQVFQLQDLKTEEEALCPREEVALEGGEEKEEKTDRPILKLANTIPLELINDL